MNHFEKLNGVNVSDHIEHKGAFAYLSWPYAVTQLRLADPTATWEVKRFAGLPYLKSDCGHFVEVAVTVQGITLSQIHPVLDGKNRPIAEPTSFDINTSIQRCLVKAIALHGLGLYIYAGEDLPEASTGTESTRPAKASKPLEGTATEPISGPVPGEPVCLNAKQIDAIRRALGRSGTDERRVLAYFQVTRLDEIPYDAFPRVMRSLQNGRQAA